MITLSILCLLFSNAVTLRRDMSILFNRIAIIALIYCLLLDVVSLSLINKGIGLHGGLLHVTNITQIFHIFVFIVSIFILQLTSFFPAGRFGKSYIVGVILSNSGNTLKFRIPNYTSKGYSGRSNYLCMVIMQEILEKVKEYRGSKSITCLIPIDQQESVIVKEQRVDGSLH